MTPRLVAVAVLSLLLVLVGRAVADKPRVAIVGDDAAVVGAVRKALAGKVVVVRDVDAGAGASDAVIVEAAGAHKLAAVITVEVTGSKKKQTATVVVRQGRDGRERGRMVVKDAPKKLARAVGKQVARKLGKAIRGAKAPAPPPAEPPAVAAAPPPPPPVVERSAAEPEAPVDDDAGASAASATEVRATVDARPRRANTIRIAVDERPFYRRLRYNDDLDDVLREYDLAANAVGVTVAARPFAAAPGFVITLGGELVVGVNGSRTDDGMEYGTSGSEWSAALGYDVRLGRLSLGLRAAFGEQRFAIDDEAMGAGGGRELVPDVTYRWARGGLDGELALSRRWSVTARGGYRHLLDTGELVDAAWFPRATGAGLDGALGLDLHLARRVTAYARAEVRHYFFAMNPVPGDDLIAGGAVDSYLGGAIGLAVAVK